MDIRIYNLFPRLYTNIEAWYPVARKAKDMGFNALYINSFLKTGPSNSIYSINDYKALDPQVFPEKSWDNSLEKLKSFIAECTKIKLQVIFDLVINHTSTDCNLISEHEDWYKHDENNCIKKAETRTSDGTLVVWEDCNKLDYSKRENGLWNYMETLCRMYLEIGFSGFRCDVATHIPVSFWKELISRLKKDYPNLLFLGESFLASPKQIIGLSEAGFDYIFNSAKWWDYCSSWFIEQNEFSRKIIPSIAFPDNHDTARLLHDANGNAAICIQKLFFTAVISGGFMLTNGFEYGFKNKLDVHSTTPSDWEKTGIDFTGFIKKALLLRDKYPVFRQEGYLDILSDQNADYVILRKCVQGQQAILLLNKSSHTLFLSKEEIELIPTCSFMDAFENGLMLQPFDFKYYIANEPKAEERLKVNETLFLTAPQTFIKRSYLLAPLRRGEAFVEISRCGICGSDYQEYCNGPYYWIPSYTGGHEFSAIICEIKPPCFGLSVGDRVVYQLPRKGSGIVQGGGYSRFAAMHTECLFRLSPWDSMTASVLIEPLAAVIHAGKMAKDANNILIAGSGTMALLLERYLYWQNPRAEITLLYKHQIISRYAAMNTLCLDIASDAMLHLNTSYEYIYECSGDTGNIPRLLGMMQESGYMILLGIYYGRAELDASSVMFQEKNIRGSFLYTSEDFSDAANLIRNKLIRVEDFIQIVPVEAYNEAFSIPSGKRIKVILRY